MSENIQQITNKMIHHIKYRYHLQHNQNIVIATTLATIINAGGHSIIVQNNEDEATIDSMIAMMSMTILYFQCDRITQLQIMQFLGDKTHSNNKNKHEQKVATILRLKIHTIVKDYRGIKEDENVLKDNNSTILYAFITETSSRVAALDEMIRERDIDHHYAWSLSSKQLIERIKNDTELLDDINKITKLGAKGEASIIVGQFISLSLGATIKATGIGTLGVIVISTVVSLLKQDLQNDVDSLKTEEDRRKTIRN